MDIILFGDLPKDHLIILNHSFPLGSKKSFKKNFIKRLSLSSFLIPLNFLLSPTSPIGSSFETVSYNISDCILLSVTTVSYNTVKKRKGHKKSRCHT